VGSRVARSDARPCRIANAGRPDRSSLSWRPPGPLIREAGNYRNLTGLPEWPFPNTASPRKLRKRLEIACNRSVWSDNR
jgi:hypothetical protein